MKVNHKKPTISNTVCQDGSSHQATSSTGPQWSSYHQADHNGTILFHQIPVDDLCRSSNDLIPRRIKLPIPPAKTSSARDNFAGYY
uniref:Uncharacterized protein n=1 Tax=Romanomermis culicivorax TaxID=13658 RepID=A0A915IA73_ROMCU